MINIRIEDEVEDVLRKAMRGQGRSVESLVFETGTSADDINEALAGNMDSPAIDSLSSALGLSAGRLVRLAGAVHGPLIELPKGVIMDNTPFPVPGYQEMTVNSYQICPLGEGTRCFAIDTGASAEALISRLESSQSILEALLLTHTHHDHVAAFERLAEFAESTFAPEKEPYGDARPIRDGDHFVIGDWRLEARATSGHSVGGMSFVLEAGEHTLAFVGDAIFCYSIGKADSVYQSALEQIRERILSLPEATIICPGHGPLTTVGYERENNPFFADL